MKIEGLVETRTPGPAGELREATVTQGMLRRALSTASLVGGALFLVNSGDALLRDGMTGALALKLSVTLVVPFVVSLTSAVLTARELRFRAIQRPAFSSRRVP